MLSTYYHSTAHLPPGVLCSPYISGYLSISGEGYGVGESTLAAGVTSCAPSTELKFTGGEFTSTADGSGGPVDCMAHHPIHLCSVDSMGQVWGE